MQDLKIGIIGGSGLGAAFSSDVKHNIDTPFGKPSDAIVETSINNVPLFFLSRHGPGHLLNPSQVPYRANIFALKQLGVTHIIASGAVGSLRDEMKPRDLVVVQQIIDKTIKRENTFYENAAVHVEFAEPFCSVLRQLLIDAGKSDGANHTVHDRGCYVAMEGPAFSTRAESLMHRLWGGDLIGMTAMPEAKLAREAEISYALIALVTDYDSWKSKPNEPHAPREQLLKEIIGHLQSASENAVTLIRRAVELAADRKEALLSADSQRSLELAIWSNKEAIPPAQVDYLRPLWGKYFS